MAPSTCLLRCPVWQWISYRRISYRGRRPLQILPKVLPDAAVARAQGWAQGWHRQNTAIVPAPSLEARPDHSTALRKRRHKVVARKPQPHRAARDNAAAQTVRRVLAGKAPEHRDRKARDRKRCDWRRGWRRSAHQQPRASQPRENRSPAPRSWFPRATAAPADRTRPHARCAEFHKAAQSREGAPTVELTVRRLAETAPRQ